MSTNKAIILAGALVALSIYLAMPLNVPVASLHECRAIFNYKEKMPRECRPWEEALRKAHEARQAVEAERREAEKRAKVQRREAEERARVQWEKDDAWLRAYEESPAYKNAMEENYKKYGRPSDNNIDRKSRKYRRAKYLSAFLGMDIETGGDIPVMPPAPSDEANADLEKEREKLRKLSLPYWSPGPPRSIRWVGFTSNCRSTPTPMPAASRAPLLTPTSIIWGCYVGVDVIGRAQAGAGG